MGILHLLKVIEEHRKRTIEKKRFKAAKKKTEMAAKIFLAPMVFNDDIIASK